MNDFVAISTETNFEEPEDHLIDLKKIKWYSVKARLFETEQELNEKKQAMLRQYHLGVIQANGLPVGVSLEQVGLSEGSHKNENSFERKRRREQERNSQKALERAQKQANTQGIKSQKIAQKFGL